jgi:ubiquinone/menaquinone biosynthesis C-methylase UbiE
MKKQKNDWDDLAKIDPFWAILSDPTKKNNEWNIDEFFETGKKEIHDVMENIKLLDCTQNFKTALDFGCGAGRLSRALSFYFDNVYGIDISETMIHLAKSHNESIKNCEFIRNEKNNLSIFKDNYFDFIYSNIVLQHMSDKFLIKSFIREFIRILNKDGILIFQLPNFISLKYRLQPRRRAYSILNKLGINNEFLINKLNLAPIIMNYIPENEIIDIVKNMNAKILSTKSFSEFDSKIKWNIYYITK